MTEEDRYESIELIVKARLDGESWFDIISELISSECEGTDDMPCSCGLESMGGSGGTLDQCYAWTTSLGVVAGKTVQPIDVAKAIIGLVDGTITAEQAENTDRAIEWARKEIEFEEYFENREWENEDTEE